MAITESHRDSFETPIILSKHLSDLLDCDVYLKLENLQPSHSFKYRGISFFIQQALKIHGPSVHLFIASSGNAAIAAACAAKNLGVIRCTVYITEGASDGLIQFLRNEGAEIVVTGTYYLQTLKVAEEAVETTPLGVLIPSYDNHLLWEGHASMIEEISEQIAGKPNAIICSVGGGGLLGGIIKGCEKIGWNDVNIFALETKGSACFYHSVSLNLKDWNIVKSPEGISAKFNEEHQVRLAYVENLSSKASSLGASSPAGAVVKMALDRISNMKFVTIPDEMAMKTALLFAEDHKFLIELACATALAPGYSPFLLNKLFGSHQNGAKKRSLVFVVDGGYKISLRDMEEYKYILESNLNKDTHWDVQCNGEHWEIPT